MARFNSVGRIAYYLAWPALFVYLRIGSRTRVAVLARDHILLVRGWLDDGKWGLPGGGLHRGEPIIAGGIREVAEETGIRLQPNECQFLRTESRSRNGLTFRAHFIVARSSELSTPHPQRGEITAVAWFPLDDVSSLRRKQDVDRVLQLLADHH